jgi:hypothetical protein
VALTATDTMSLTVAPAAGAVNDTVGAVGVGAGAGPAFEMLTATCVDAVLPVESTARATIVCGPFGNFVVSHAIDTGPRLLLLGVVATVSPLTVSVYVFDVLAVPFSHSTTHDMPLTVVPALGAVIARLNVSAPGEGGVVVVLDTVTVRDPVVAVLPAASVTVTLSEWRPLPNVVVIHENVGPAPGTLVPSTAS